MYIDKLQRKSMPFYVLQPQSSK